MILFEEWTNTEGYYLCNCAAGGGGNRPECNPRNQNRPADCDTTPPTMMTSPPSASAQPTTSPGKLSEERRLNVIYGNIGLLCFVCRFNVCYHVNLFQGSIWNTSSINIKYKQHFWYIN